MTDPGWLIELAIEPTHGEGARLAAALAAIGTPLAFEAIAEPESGQLILRGRSEARLEAALAWLGALCPGGFAAGSAQVAYRQAAVRPSEIGHIHKRLPDGRGEFAEVILGFAPGEPGSGIQFANESPSGHIPDRYLSSVEEGVREAAASAGPCGWALTDTKISLRDGKYHDLDSSEAAFRAAGRGAVEAADHAGRFTLVEPRVKLALLVPGECAAAVLAALARRQIEIQEVRDAAAILAHGRMADLLGFEAELREATAGRGQAVFLCDGYSELPSRKGGPDDDMPAAAALCA